MNSKMKQALKAVSNIMVISVIILAFLLHGTQLIGLKPYTVLSGSMESVYPTGSLIYVKKIDPSTLEKGDIITFQLSNDIVATHRIIEIIEDEDNPGSTSFRTKGDENDIADGKLVNYENVIGQPIFCIPFLGYLAVFIMKPPGQIIAFLVGGAFLLIEVIIGVLLEDDDSNEENKKGEIKNEEE